MSRVNVAVRVNRYRRVVYPRWMGRDGGRRMVGHSDVEFSMPAPPSVGLRVRHDGMSFTLFDVCYNVSRGEYLCGAEAVIGYDDLSDLTAAEYGEWADKLSPPETDDEGEG